jgi:acyl-CoA dehydrogenase
MSTTLEIDETTRDLVEEVRDWSTKVGRPLARESDRMNGLPLSPAELLKTCPIDTAPNTLPSIELTDEALEARPWLRTAKIDGRAHVASRLVEAMAYGDGWVSTGLPNPGIAGDLVARMGTPEQIDKYVGGIARGEYHLSAWGMTEETGGNDVASIKSTLTADGDDYILNGSKRFLSTGADADWAVVFATIDPALKMAGIRAVIVERGTPGFTIVRPYEEKLGQRFNRQATYKFDNVRIPRQNFLAGSRDGADLMSALRTFNRTRPFCNATSVGMAQACIDYALGFVKQQRNSMSPRRWDRVAEEFADMNYLLEEQRGLCHYASWRTDHGLPDIKESSQAKVHAPRLGEGISLRCMQLVGPDALSEAHLLEKWYRDARQMEIVEGTTHIQKMVISRQILGEDAARA